VIPLDHPAPDESVYPSRERGETEMTWISKPQPSREKPTNTNCHNC
jgi:hypothetical protein